ncbi:hypothetical protein [Planococcus sp. YIM B11945]|uniref:hypothetical protein n=1 Tax=Planococcus sp. YIM B11945 TaxID=3435410 RepID=UPI003D7CDCE1
MNVQRLMPAILSFAATTGGLYMAGHVWTVPLLMFHYEYQDKANGFSIACGSFLPVLIGLAAAALAEKYVGTNKKKIEHT